MSTLPVTKKPEHPTTPSRNGVGQMTATQIAGALPDSSGTSHDNTDRRKVIDPDKKDFGDGFASRRHEFHWDF